MPTTTYEPIQTYTVSGTSTTSITFSTISSVYTELKMVASIDSTSENDLYVQVNGDTTGGNYGYGGLSGWQTGSPATNNTTEFKATSYAGALLDYYGTPTNTGLGQHLVIVSIPDPQGSHHKIFRSNSVNYKPAGTPAVRGGVDEMVSIWKSNAAITALTFTQGSPRVFTAGSKFTLFGLRTA